MKERPILFSGEMVRAMLDGRKTQTRRVVMPLPTVEYSITGPMWTHAGVAGYFAEHVFGSCLAKLTTSPYGVPGDRLWVREPAWRDTRDAGVVIYEATPELARYQREPKKIIRASFPDEKGPPPTREFMRAEMERNQFWNLRPSFLMPRWASRLTLELTGVRAERVQDISYDDCRDEGTRCPTHGFVQHTACSALRAGYRDLWNSLNEKRGFGWDINPWVWVLEFRTIDVRQSGNKSGNAPRLEPHLTAATGA